MTQAYRNIAQDMITQDTILRHRTGEMTVRGYWYEIPYKQRNDAFQTKLIQQLCLLSHLTR